MEAVSQLKECSSCSSEFPIFSGDVEFLNSAAVPIPDLCFHCRLQRRAAFYNRRSLYWRKCDHSGKQILSWMSPDKPYKVYDKEIWYSDAWDAMEFGRDFDFTRPFFEQFHELMQEVPFIALAVYGHMENSDYCNDVAYLRNCYLVYDCGKSEDTLYGETFAFLKDCMEVLSLAKCELCYECVSCLDSYGLKFSRFCRNCSDSWFLRDCIGCRNCFACANLHQKEYHIYNKPVPRGEYESFIAHFNSGSFAALSKARAEAEEFFKSQPVKATRGVQTVDCLGEWINSSKGAFYCFNCNDLEDCRYCTDVIMGAKSCMDVHVWGDNTERCYNCCIVGEGAHRLLCCCFTGFDASDIYYSYYCTRGVRDLFACIGLQKKQYCIFNKQYTRAQYQELSKRIIEHMRATGEWGSYFPPQFSPFGYNESLAFNYFPLTREEVLRRGWQWSDFEAPVKARSVISAEQIPDQISRVEDNIVDLAVTCETSGKPFKIIAKELENYRRANLPVPHRHPEERHRDRLHLRQEYGLWDRPCAQCCTVVPAAYAPDSDAIVYCEECYRVKVWG